MLDTASVSVYKYLAVNSSGGVYKGRISEIMRATGLSRMDVLKVLSQLEEEKYVQVVYSPVNPTELFTQLAGTLFKAEAEYIGAIRGLLQTPLEGAKKAIEEERDLALKYLSGTEYEELLAVDVTSVVRELETLNRELAKAFSLYVDLNPSSVLGETVSVDNSMKYLRRLDRFIDLKNTITEEDVVYLSTALSIFMEVPARKKTIMKSSTQQIIKNLEDLEQNLEEVEARILIEGATPELVNMRLQIKSKIDSLRKSLASTKEGEVYFIEKSEVPQLLTALNSKEALFSEILEGLRSVSKSPLSEKVGTTLAKALELIRIERDILKKLERKII
jgi:DNA-binding transcriptional regulator GbsR (MarR family)